MQSPIKDQGQRSTCVAFAATAGHEYLRNDNVDLSEEFLYWGCKHIDGVFDDNGTTLNSAITSLKSIGQANETDWPYDPYLVLPSGLYSPSGEALKNAYSNKINTENRIPINVEYLKRKLEDNNAIIIGISIFEEFFNQIKGIIELPANENMNYGGHALLVIGWDDHLYNGIFIVRNSWGTSWGENGYAYLPYAYFLKYTLDAWSFNTQ